MEMREMVEFYCEYKLIASVHSSMVPTVGARINIRRKTYKVRYVSYALDHADDFTLRRMRASVDLDVC
jgi:hypothetical protein